MLSGIEQRETPKPWMRPSRTHKSQLSAGSRPEEVTLSPRTKSSSEGRRTMHVEPGGAARSGDRNVATQRPRSPSSAPSCPHRGAV